MSNSKLEVQIKAHLNSLEKAGVLATSMITFTPQFRDVYPTPNEWLEAGWTMPEMLEKGIVEIVDVDEVDLSGVEPEIIIPKGSLAEAVVEAMRYIGEDVMGASDAVKKFTEACNSHADDEPVSFEQMVTNLAKSGEDILKTMTPVQAHLMHMNWGVGGEVGELSDALKKYVIYNKELDLINVVEELGDVEFYLEGLRQGLGITRQETIDANQKKLLTGKNARYAEGKFTDEQAQSRSDKAPVTDDEPEINNTVYLYNIPESLTRSDLVTLGEHFKCNGIMKNWDGEAPIPSGTLVLLNEEPADAQALYLNTGNCVMPFSIAMKIASK